MRSLKLTVMAALAATGCATFAAMGRRGLPSKFEDAAVTIGEVAVSTLRLKYRN
ncbi:MAG: hypothetical protein AB3N21_12330 [Ruegeria sp.]|uniref:hypothetical protein n=1 Tax=Ruegeria sp. TaxID=1879320 RepID=UPI00349E5899